SGRRPASGRASRARRRRRPPRRSRPGPGRRRSRPWRGTAPRRRPAARASDRPRPRGTRAGWGAGSRLSFGWRPPTRPIGTPPPPGERIRVVNPTRRWNPAAVAGVRQTGRRGVRMDGPAPDAGPDGGAREGVARGRHGVRRDEDGRAVARGALARGVRRAARGGHRAPVDRRAARGVAARHVPVPRVRERAVPRRDQVRRPLRLAELLPPDRRRRRRARRGPQPRDGAHRGALRPLRVPPRPRVRRRPADPDGRQVLHELDRPVLRAGGRVTPDRARPPRRPAMLDKHAAEAVPDAADPTLRREVAHTTAAALVHRGRASTDPQVHARLVRLVEAEGLDTVAGLWADGPADTLPGALWRLYALREWVRRDPRTVADRYRLG